MPLDRFDAAVSRPSDAFGSQARAQLWLARLEPGPAIRISVMHLGLGGGVGYHQAGSPQLFAVVQGAGRVRVPIAAGQAAFWAGGERRAAGLTAVVRSWSKPRDWTRRVGCRPRIDGSL